MVELAENTGAMNTSTCQNQQISSRSARRCSLEDTTVYPNSGKNCIPLFSFCRLEQTVHVTFFRPQQGYRIFNTWMGEPSKVLLLEKVVEVIKRDNLLSIVQASGKT